MLPSIKIYDKSFYPDLSTSKYHPNIKNFRWCRDEMIPYTDNKIIVYTDLCLSEVDNAPHDAYKIALLIEPYVIDNRSYQYIQQNYNKFDLVLTHHTYMMDLIPNAEYCSSEMSWIDSKDFRLYSKSKDVSIIASEKNYAPGHSLRHQLIAQYMHSSCGIGKILDIYGRGYAPIQHKIEALKDYKYHIAIENCQQDLYYTEKLLDAFLTGSVPIYFGPPNIDTVFNADGMLLCNSIEGLMTALDYINCNGKEHYESDKVQKAIKENYNLAQRYLSIENFIYDNVLKPKGLL
jgi:hypothetical protein